MTVGQMEFSEAVEKEGEYGKDRDLGGLHVNTSNTLVRAAHGLTLNEKRLVACCVAKLDSIRTARHPNYDQTRVKLTAAEFADTYGIDPKTSYRELVVASDRLFKREVRFSVETPKGARTTKYHWVDEATYQDGEGWVDLKFSDRITQHLTLLRKEYTSYKLKNAASLRSMYSWRLYELLVSVWNKKNHPIMQGALHIKMEDLRWAMEVPESYAWGQVNQKAIKPAIAELSNLHNLKITMTTKKKARSVVSLSFNFEVNSQAKLDI